MRRRAPIDHAPRGLNLTVLQFALDEELKEPLVDALSARVVAALGPVGDRGYVWVVIDDSPTQLGRATGACSTSAISRHS